MKPDAKGCLRVFVGGKYGEWTSVQNDDDSVTLVPVTSTNTTIDPRQLCLSDDPDFSTFPLGGGHEPI